MSKSWEKILHYKAKSGKTSALEKESFDIFLRYKNPPFTDTNSSNGKYSKWRSFYMKATGIVRRIDDLGRVVVPKEIRKTLHIREGDPL